MLSPERANVLGATSSPADLRRRCAAPLCKRQPRSVGRRFPVPPKIPCSSRKNSLFSGGTGNPLQDIESVWRPAPKTAQRDRNRAKFSKDSVLISLFSGNVQRSRHESLRRRNVPEDGDEGRQLTLP